MDETSTDAKAAAFPDYLEASHILSFVNHDVLVHLLKAGEKEGSFSRDFAFRGESDRVAFSESADVFEWFTKTERVQERALFLRQTIFPGLLSDFLHFVYEALETSRKAKLNVTYALLRKPLQDSLFLFEVMAIDPLQFAETLAAAPEKLDSKKAGGLDAHAKRIAKVLALLGEEERFDAAYLAQLRYDKSADDGFDGSCNKALHLFTGHEAIRTEPLNVNFIFSGWDQKLSQWYFLYSRMPYLLFYARRLVEHLFATFESRTDPAYLADIERRIEAGTVLWAPNVDSEYRHPKIEHFVDGTRKRLFSELATLGLQSPTTGDLVRIRDAGVIKRPT